MTPQDNSPTPRSCSRIQAGNQPQKHSSRGTCASFAMVPPRQPRSGTRVPGASRRFGLTGAVVAAEAASPGLTGLTGGVGNQPVQFPVAASARTASVLSWRDRSWG